MNPIIEYTNVILKQGIHSAEAKQLEKNADEVTKRRIKVLKKLHALKKLLGY